MDGLDKKVSGLDRMEFVTIGGLTKGITLDDIRLGVSVLRNENLANIFYRLKLIEAYGTGILKMNECYEGYFMKPGIHVSDNAFKIVLPNTNYQREVTRVRETMTWNTGIAVPREQRYESVIALCRKQGFIVRKDVQRILGVSQPTAILLLREMVENGILVKRGAARNLCYYLK